MPVSELVIATGTPVTKLIHCEYKWCAHTRHHCHVIPPWQQVNAMLITNASASAALDHLPGSNLATTRVYRGVRWQAAVHLSGHGDAAMLVCSTPDEAREWVETQADALGVRVEWVSEHWRTGQSI